MSPSAELCCLEARSTPAALLTHCPGLGRGPHPPPRLGWGSPTSLWDARGPRLPARCAPACPRTSSPHGSRGISSLPRACQALPPSWHGARGSGPGPDQAGSCPRRGQEVFDAACSVRALVFYSPIVSSRPARTTQRHSQRRRLV